MTCGYAWYNGTEMVELDRVAETAFNSTATEIWFATQEPIPAENARSALLPLLRQPFGGISAG
jgi:hypothetical protein